jgi:hypothetical protein
MIRLDYIIKGAKFRRDYPDSDWRVATLRARLLRDENATPVKITRHVKPRRPKP